MMSSAETIATFFDGRSSRPYTVTVCLLDEGMQISGNGLDPVLWSYGSTYNQDEFIKSRDLTLANRLYPGAQLLVAASDAASVLGRLHGNHRSMTRISASIPVVFALLVLSVGLIVGTGLAVRHSSGFIASLIPASWENSLDDLVAVYTEDAVDYQKKQQCRALSQQELLHKLLAGLAPHVPKNLRILIDPTKQVNAFALPGNTIVVNQGLLDFAKNEQEILGVLAHEIAHLNRRHVMEMLVQRMGLRMVLSAMMGNGGASTISAQVFEMGYSRDHEREADKYAVEYLAKSGVSSEPLAEFLRRIEDREEVLKKLTQNKVVGYFISHPLADERKDILKEGFRPENSRPSRLSPVEFRELKNPGLRCKS